MASKIQFRRDTYSNWTSNNPILSEGEIGLDLTNGTFKIGNGVTAWNSLSVSFISQSQLTNILNQITEW